MSFRSPNEPHHHPEPLNPFEWIPLEWALEKLQVDEEGLKRLIALGEIKATGSGDKMRVKKSDVEQHHSLWMSFSEVLEELQIDDEELNRLVSNAELRAFKNASQMRFKKADVMNLKIGGTSEPTIILTDSDVERDYALARQADNEETVIITDDDEDDQEIKENVRALEKQLQDLGILEKLKQLGQWPATNRFYPPDGSSAIMFHSDSPFVITTKSSRRKAMVVYVEAEEGKYTPRLIYGSTTHIAIKALPRVMVDEEGRIRHFDKGDSEDSITLKTPYQLRLAHTLNGVQEAGELKLYDEEDSRLIKAVSNPYPDTEKHNKAFRNDSFYGFVEGVSMLATQTSGDTAMGQNTIRIDAQYRKPSKVHLKDADESFDPVHQCDEYLPTILLRRVTFQHEKYGEVEAFFFRSERPSAATNYMVCRVPLPPSAQQAGTHGIMIAAMDPAVADINGYLVSEEYFKDVEAVTVPLLEKRETVMRIGDDSGYDNAFIKKFGLVASGNEHGDISMWNYLKHVPVIQAFEAKIEAILSPDKKRAFLESVRPLLRSEPTAPAPSRTPPQKPLVVPLIAKQIAAAVGAVLLVGAIGVGVVKVHSSSEASKDQSASKQPPAPDVPVSDVPHDRAPVEEVIQPTPAPQPIEASEAPVTTSSAEPDRSIELQREYEELLKEAHDFLNPSSMTAAQCDEAIAGWAATPSHPDQARRIAEWQEVKRLVILEADVRVLLQRLVNEEGEQRVQIRDLDQVLNPQNITLESVLSAISEWEKPEYAHHPARAQTLQQWKVWKFLLEFQGRVRAHVGRRG